jgi:DNA-binding MarR family transcriptional regulator
MDQTPFTNLHEGMEGVLAHIIQNFMNAMKQHGLSTSQIHTLMYIFHAGECQVSDIGDLADVSNAAASQLVERLVQQGLVDRREDPKDRRNKLVTLSEKGEGLFHESVMSNQYLMEIMTALTPKQRQAVHDAFMLLAQTGRELQKAHESEENQHAQES